MDLLEHILDQQGFEGVDGGQIELGFDPDPLVNQPDPQPVVDVLQIVMAAEKIEHIAPLRGAQPYEGIGIPDQQGDLGDGRLLLVEAIHRGVDPWFYLAAITCQPRHILLIEQQ